MRLSPSLSLTTRLYILWRLKFLATIPAEPRDQLLDRVANNTASPDVKKIISLLHGAFHGESNWDVGAFLQKAEPSFRTPETPSQKAGFYIILNGMAEAFLWPPERLFFGAVAADFAKCRKATIPDVVNHLFRSTTFYFFYPETMKNCASLVTFRDQSADQIVAVFNKHRYFHRRRNFTYDALLLFWLTNLALLAVIPKAGREKSITLCAYATALTMVGLMMMLVSCFLTEFGPRYTLPMWELTIVSVTILFAHTADRLRGITLLRQQIDRDQRESKIWNQHGRAGVILGHSLTEEQS